MGPKCVVLILNFHIDIRRSSHHCDKSKERRPKIMSLQDTCTKSQTFNMGCYSAVTQGIFDSRHKKYTHHAYQIKAQVLARQFIARSMSCLLGQGDMQQRW